MAADICVALAKYSHALGVNADNTIPWIHHATSNIYLVLKGEDTHIQNGQLCMQVVQGNTTLETINIGELVDRSIEARNGSQRAGITPQIEQLPIFGIHKDIFLALRYHLPDGQARRVQFRLESAHDCTSMIRILQQRGMEFQQQRPRTARPNTSRLGTSGSQERPSTIQASYSANNAFVARPDPLKPSPIRMPVLEAGGLSSQHSSSTEGPLPTVQRPPRQSLLQYTTHSTPPHEPISSITTYDADHPMAAQDLPRSHIIPFEKPVDDAVTRYPDTPNRTHVTSTPSHGLGKPVNEDLVKASSSSESRSNLHRPLLPALLRMPETLEHEMPPRRELPFKRPGSHQSSSSRPSTTSKSVCDYNAIGGSSDSTMISSLSSPTKQLGINRPATASPLKSAIASVVSHPVKQAQAIQARPQSHASTLSYTPSVKLGAKTIEAAVPQGTFRRPSDLGELLRITKPHIERSPNSSKVARLDSTADAAYELETPPGTSSSLMRTNAPEVPSPTSRAGVGHMASTPNQRSDLTMPTSPLRNAGVGDLNTSSMAEVAAVESASLAGYASQSREDRQTVLDEFMVSKLEDPNFAVLCEDLDSCWRRIALGL